MFFKILLGLVSTAGAACAVGVPANDWGGWYGGINGSNYDGGFNSWAYPCPTMSGYKKIQTHGDRFYPYWKLENSSFKFYEDSKCLEISQQPTTLDNGKCQCPSDSSENSTQQVKLIGEDAQDSSNNCFCLNGKKD